MTYIFKTKKMLRDYRVKPPRLQYSLSDNYVPKMNQKFTGKLDTQTWWLTLHKAPDM